MLIPINTTISNLIDEICTTPADEEELLQILDKFIIAISKLPEEQYREIWQAMMNLRLANSKIIDISKRDDLLEPQAGRCQSCKAGLLYIARLEHREAQQNLDEKTKIL